MGRASDETGSSAGTVLNSGRHIAAGTSSSSDVRMFCWRRGAKVVIVRYLSFLATVPMILDWANCLVWQTRATTDARFGPTSARALQPVATG
jgi:hypothetical protein